MFDAIKEIEEEEEKYDSLTIDIDEYGMSSVVKFMLSFFKSFAVDISTEKPDFMAGLKRGGV